MESFFRIVQYLDLYEENKKLYTAGFVKWDCRDKRHCIEVNIKDLEIDNVPVFLILKPAMENIGKIEIKRGRGYFKDTYTMGEKGSIITNGKEIELQNVDKLEISLCNHMYLCGKLEIPVDKMKKESNKIEIDIQKNGIIEEENEISTKKDIVIHKKCGKDCEIERSHVENITSSILNISKKSEEIVENYENNIENYVDNEENHVENKFYEEKEKENKKTFSVKVEKPLPHDKWNQLCIKYKVVHPFPKQSPFISITPKDFVILQQGYQKLVHNSFLLHGYYNYGHVILGSLEEENEQYYIGVPGVYYEQEKKAARMFGFVGFEGVEDVVDKGSFGYYMIEVKI